MTTTTLSLEHFGVISGYYARGGRISLKSPLTHANDALFLNPTSSPNRSAIQAMT